MDCVAPPSSKGGRRNPSVTSSRFLVAKGDFRPTYVLHLLERHLGGAYLLDGARLQAIDRFTQHRPILQPLCKLCIALFLPRELPLHVKVVTQQHISITVRYSRYTRQPRALQSRLGGHCLEYRSSRTRKGRFATAQHTHTHTHSLYGFAKTTSYESSPTQKNTDEHGLQATYAWASAVRML